MRIGGDYSSKAVFYSACAGMVFFGIALISIGAVLPLVSVKFGLDELKASSVVIFLPVGVLAGSLFFGPFVDRFGYKLLLIISSLITITGLAWLGIAEDMNSLRTAVFMTGFGGGILNGETNTIVSDISGSERNANLSFLAFFFGIGALGVPFVMRFLGEIFSYPVILAGIAGVMFLFVISFLFVRFPMPKQPHGFPVREGINLIKKPRLLLLSLVLFFQSGLEGVTNNWTTTYFEKAGMASGDKALLALTLMVAGMTLTRLVLGIVLKKVRSFVVIIAGLVVILFAIIIIIVLPDARLPGITLLGIGYAPVFPVILAYIGTLYPDLSGTAFSVALFIALTGNISMNFLMGVFAGIYGMAAFPLLLLSAVILMTVVFFIASGRNSLKE